MDLAALEHLLQTYGLPTAMLVCIYWSFVRPVSSAHVDLVRVCSSTQRSIVDLLSRIDAKLDRLVDQPVEPPTNNRARG